MDRLEHDLRDLLTSERHVLATDLVSLDRVHAGARRRHRRRTAAVAALSALVAVSVAVPVTLQVAAGRSGAPLGTAKQPGSTAVTTRPPDHTVVAPAGPAWGDSAVLSVTATSTRTFVVLGAAKGCTTSPCLRLAQSSDEGRTFTPLAVPAGAHPGGDGPTPSSALDVRFGSSSDGWVYGDGLWSTHDGGTTWLAQRLPGRVERLEAAAGTAWALVTDGLDGVDVSLWRSPVGRDDWTKVPDVALRYGVDLTVQRQHVVAVGSNGSKAWVGDGGTFTAVDDPCSAAGGGPSLATRLSATGSLWASCASGTSARLLASPDGSAWQQVVPSFLPDALPNQVVVGARTASDALLSVGPGEPFYRVRSDGSGGPVKGSPTADGATSYIGFTDASVGYAISGNQLWRTDDGGDTWRLVRVG